VHVSGSASLSGLSTIAQLRSFLETLVRPGGCSFSCYSNVLDALARSRSGSRGLLMALTFRRRSRVLAPAGVERLHARSRSLFDRATRRHNQGPELDDLVRGA
jgi:hypothetical protein